MGNRIEKVCFCGVTYTADETRLKHGRETTCSKACSYRLRGMGLKNQSDLFCSVCGAGFCRPKSHIKSKHQSVYCSRACQYYGRKIKLTKRIVAKPYQYSAEGKTKLIKVGCKTYAAGKGLKYPKTEMAVVDHLIKLRINFIHQHIVETEELGFVADFFFPELKMVIELDVKATHKKTADRDLKMDSILSQNGITCIRVDDNGNEQNAIKSVMDALVVFSKQ